MSETPVTSELPPATAGALTKTPGGARVLTPPPIKPEGGLNTFQWGMIAFLVSEVAFFSTLIVAYLTFMGKDKSGPKPEEVLSLPFVIVTTILLLSSSGTIHMAEKALHSGSVSGFLRWWGLTILLGVSFLAGTAYEWYELIVHHHLTISRNLFGTTYYTLVGFHGAHVTGGVIVMLIFFGLGARGQITHKNRGGIEMTSWYWHFVDVVWVVVFIVVYLIGR